MKSGIWRACFLPLFYTIPHLYGIFYHFFAKCQVFFQLFSQNLGKQKRPSLVFFVYLIYTLIGYDFIHLPSAPPPRPLPPLLVGVHTAFRKVNTSMQCYGYCTHAPSAPTTKPSGVVVFASIMPSAKK